MAVAILRESEISETLDATIRKNLVLSFPHNEQLFMHSREWRGNVPLFSVVVTEGDDVAAHLAVADRTVKVGAELVRVAGVANVFVMPDYQHQGYVGKMLGPAMAEAERVGFDFGMLFAGEHTKQVYGRYGWVEIVGRRCVCVSEGQESDVLPDSVQMYYPLRRTDFPAGTIHLRGDKW